MKSTIFIKIDWLVQIIGIAAIIILMCFGKHIEAWAMGGGVLIWQVFSALTGVILTRGRDSSRTLFLFLLFMLMAAFSPYILILRAYAIIIPLALMIYHLSLTTRSLRLSLRTEGSFLRHISF